MLREDFFFIPQGGRVDNASGTPYYATQSVPQPESDELARQKADLERERQDLAREKQELERQKALDAEREQFTAQRERLAAERQRIERERQSQVREQEKTVVAMGPRPSVSTARETRRDGSFIAYNDGTVLDTSTNLMWAAKDNGEDIYWQEAKSYCENYRGGGYSDWRMPTQNELAGLYDEAKTYKSVCTVLFGGQWNLRLTELIRLTCNWAWASETRGSDAALFVFNGGGLRSWNLKTAGDSRRALPVRSAK
jgi:hypothetical protein